MAMTHNERDRQHRARLAQIEAVQVVSGTGDGARVNHERTVIERARMLAEELASHAATERGLAALDRLLRSVEDRSAAHRAEIAPFLDAVWNGKPLGLACLRAVDHRTACDMIEVLEAWRYARLNLAESVRGGPRRVSAALRTCRAATPEGDATVGQ